MADFQPPEDWEFINDREFAACAAYQDRLDKLDAAFHRVSADTMGAVRPAEGEFWVGAQCVTVRTPVTRGHLVQSGASRRGKIGEFSKKSRLRLLRLVAKLRREVLPLFVTLTYPGEVPGLGGELADYRVWKGHLKALWKRVRRRWPKAAAIWRMEFQARGAPHFHLLLYGVPLDELFIRADKRNPADLRWRDSWLNKAWYKVVGSGDVLHWEHGCDAAAVRSYKGAMAYAAKYATKPAEDAVGFPARGKGSLFDELGGDGVGRLWGVLGRADLPFGAKVIIRLVGPECWNLRRALVRLTGVQPRSRKGLTVFASGDVWLRYAEEGHCLGSYRGGPTPGRFLDRKLGPAQV